MEFSSLLSELDHLPKNVQKQILDYIEFLLSKYPKKNSKTSKEFKFDWEGGLKELKNKYTSVELQHLTNDLR